MGVALAWRLGFGLLVLALLSPTQTGGDNRTTTSPLSNSSEVTSGPLSTLNRTTTRGHGNSLQSTAGLFMLSVSLLSIC
uniref:CD24 molecule n=1 Tax=Ailuropoda melanoleuca TaxID=9646 RepID=A0A7N5P527_AILME